LRDKTLTTKKDAVEETRLRLQAQEATDSETPSSGGDPLTNGYGYGNNNGEKRPSTGSSNGQPLPHSKSADALDNATMASSAALSATTTTTHSYPSRRPPDGRENDELLRLKAAGGVGEVQRATSAAAVILSEKGTAASAEAVQIQSSKEAANGKINVQVTVLVGESTAMPATCRARFRFLHPLTHAFHQTTHRATQFGSQGASAYHGESCLSAILSPCQCQCLMFI